MADEVESIGWGAGQPLAPSIKRRDPAGWIKASLFSGACCSALALIAVWRPLPGLAGPVGDLGAHALVWGEAAVRLVLPHAFQRAIDGYAAFWASLDASQRLAIVWRLGVAAWAFLMPFPLLYAGFMLPRDALIHLRGSRRHGRFQSPALLRSKHAKACRLGPDHDIAPGVPWPADMWARHTIVVGGTGSGKSTALVKPLVEKIVAARESMLLFDIKGDLTEHWDGLAIIAPWDSRSFAWDIARDLQNIGAIRKFAEAAVPGSEKDPMWSSAARQILTGVILHLRRERGDDWGFAELAELLSAPQPELLEMMIQCLAEATRAVEKTSVTTQGILINLASFCSPIFDLARAWGSHPKERRISFADWVEGRSKQRRIVLQGHDSYTELTKCYARGIVECVASLVASAALGDAPSRKLWLVLDEVAALGAIPMRRLFELGRSRNLRMVVTCQDLAQLDEVHGEKLVRSLVSMGGSLLIGQMQQGETADGLAKALGTREVERPNVSTSIQGSGSERSATLSYSRDEVAVYKPSEFGSRLGPTADRKGVVLALVSGGDAYELQWPIFPRRKLRPAHVPAPWTTGLSGLGGMGPGGGGMSRFMAVDPKRDRGAASEPAIDGASRDETIPARPGLRGEVATVPRFEGPGGDGGNGRDAAKSNEGALVEPGLDEGDADIDELEVPKPRAAESKPPSMPAALSEELMAQMLRESSSPGAAAVNAPDPL